MLYSAICRSFTIGLIAVAMSACSTVSNQSASTIPATPLSASRGIPAGGASGSLLYVSDVAANTVSFYSYGNGKLRGSIDTGLSEPQGLCSDAKGNVFVSNSNDSEVIEYAHGAKVPSQTLATTGEFPVACATSVSGILAVANICSSPSCNAGNIELFPGETGSPTVVTCPNLSRYYYDGYDSKGNLFVDGQNASGQFILCEVPAGSSKGKAITLNKAPAFPGSVQWDGKYLAILDPNTTTIGRYKIHGATGSLEGTVPLTGASSGVFFLASKDQALAFVGAEIGFFNYPEGGNPVKTLHLKNVVDALGFTISPSKVL